jgi:hypothetical protein
MITVMGATGHTYLPNYTIRQRFGVKNALDYLVGQTQCGSKRSSTRCWMLDGTHRSTPLWQIVLHVVNHGTLHGGQCGRDAATGSVPPQTDILFYYREPEAPGAGTQHQLLRDC